MFVNGRRGDGSHRLVPGDWFRVGHKEYGLRIVADHPARSGRATFGDPALPMGTGELSDPSLGRARRVDFGDEPTKSDLDQPEPVELMRESGQQWLADQGLPPLDRFESALNMVELLTKANADSEAGDLLAQAIDLLELSQAQGILPPSAAHRARLHIDRWIAESGAESTWRLRLETLDHAEGRMPSRGPGDGR